MAKIIYPEEFKRPSPDISKESGPRGPGFGSTPGRGRFMTELLSTFNWSVGVLEYWKTEHMTNIFRESNPRLTGFYSLGAQEP